MSLPKIIKAPRYHLALQGFTSPSFMNRRGDPAIITIDGAREITGYNMRFTLKNGEPDLPVGAQAELKLDGDFYLQLCADLEQEQYTRDAHKQAREAKLTELNQHAYNDSKQTNMALLESKPSPENLVALLESCERAIRAASIAMKNSRYANWEIQWIAEQEQAKAHGISRAFDDLLIELVNRLNADGYQLHTEYAYSPKEGCGRAAYNPGAEHLITSIALKQGNLRREPHDALCKPRSKFNALSPLHDKPLVSCIRCLSMLFSIYCKNNG